MNNSSINKNGTIIIRVMCAIVFCLFSFCWLYFFQADALTVAQHVLSGGATHYDRTIGAILITLTLIILQLVVASITQLYRRSHALTYLPSMLTLAVISDISPDIDINFSFGAWWWVIPLVLIVWSGIVWLAKQIAPFNNGRQPMGLFSAAMCINMAFMTAMMLAVAAIANTNAVFHFRCHAEKALSDGNTEEALRVGNRSWETDANLTMLRAFALSKRNEMGERLFNYPVAGKGDDLVPMEKSSTRLLLLSPDSIYKHLGAIPKNIDNSKEYLRLLERDSLASPAVADYKLCSMLIDRKIDEFVQTLPQYYTINDSLPRHYREALVLYAHQRSNPVIVYKNSVLDEDWRDLQQLTKTYPDKRERKGKIHERYFGSYWYYYIYKN